MRPAGPTNGLPSISSRSPGCSPTNMTGALLGPSPKTVCVPFFHKSHALHPAAMARSSANVLFGGIRTSAGNSFFSLFFATFVLPAGQMYQGNATLLLSGSGRCCESRNKEAEYSTNLIQFEKPKL